MVRRYREDCNVHTAAQCCITIGVLTGVVYLDAKRPISVKEDGEMADDAELSLRDVLTSVMVEGKPLIRVVAQLNDSTVMVISATSPERDAALANIYQCTAAWVMFTLVFEHNVRDRAHKGCHGVLRIRWGNGHGLVRHRKRRPYR